MRKIVILSILVFLVSACTTAPATDKNWRPDTENANYGKYPQNYPQIIQTWGNKNFDKAAKLNYLAMSVPRHEYLMLNSEQRNVIYGYSVCVDVSGIRSHGAYKPVQKHWFFIRDGKVIAQRNLDYAYNWEIYRDHKISCEDGN